MSSASTVTYTSVYTDSEPGRVFWGADEELFDGGSLRVIVYGYDGLLMKRLLHIAGTMCQTRSTPPFPGLSTRSTADALTRSPLSTWPLHVAGLCNGVRTRGGSCDLFRRCGDDDDEPSNDDEDDDDTDDEDEEPFEDEDDDEEEDHADYLIYLLLTLFPQMGVTEDI
ncbi:hypothetical protein Tco_1090559 [Tanacetum coccineum]|uniref:Uncharacterized protein n=1 Tax=Tanacetum coccineum TaxID=301880 RepID=A0ABQ5I4J1_9ASTR